MSNEKTSCTTTNLKVADNEATRHPILAPVTDNPERLGVHAENPGAGNTGTINSGLSCGSQIPPIVVKPAVGVKTITGSYAGNHTQPTAPLSMDFAKNPPPVRAQMHGQQNSRNYKEDGGASVSTTTPDAGDGG